MQRALAARCIALASQEGLLTRLMATHGMERTTEADLPGAKSQLASDTITIEVALPDRGDQSTASSSEKGQFRLKNPSLPHMQWLSPKKPIDVQAALEQLKAQPKRKFEETVEMAIRLGTDPRRGDQQVRGAVNLPYGTGKTTKVCVFADGEAAEIARTAGADVVGTDATIADIKDGTINFDKCLAIASMMPKLSSVARVLGPRGLMPNPKLGTLITAAEIPQALQQMRAGRVEYRADKQAVVHAGIGKLSFPAEHLYRNLGVLANTILNARPKGVKGSGPSGYILSVHLSSTMGPGLAISMPSFLAAAQRSKNFVPL